MSYIDRHAVTQSIFFIHTYTGAIIVYIDLICTAINICLLRSCVVTKKPSPNHCTYHDHVNKQTSMKNKLIFVRKPFFMIQ